MLRKSLRDKVEAVFEDNFPLEPPEPEPTQDQSDVLLLAAAIVKLGREVHELRLLEFSRRVDGTAHAPD